MGVVGEVDSNEDAQTISRRAVQWEQRADELDPCVWELAKAERARAHAKHQDTSMEAADPISLDRLAILLEEVGEVAREFNEARHRGEPVDADLLHSELIQVGAMALTWAANLAGDSLAVG